MPAALRKRTSGLAKGAAICRLAVLCIAGRFIPDAG
jgi:hypothetical protein